MVDITAQIAPAVLALIAVLCLILFWVAYAAHLAHLKTTLSKWAKKEGLELTSAEPRWFHMPFSLFITHGILRSDRIFRIVVQWPDGTKRRGFATIRCFFHERVLGVRWDDIEEPFEEPDIPEV